MDSHSLDLSEFIGRELAITNAQYSLLSVKACIYKVCSNAKQKELHLFLLGDEKFSHSVLNRHRNVLPTENHLHLPISYVNKKIRLKVTIKKEELLNDIEEGMRGMFYIIMVHTSVMPHNTIKDFLIFFKPFSENEK